MPILQLQHKDKLLGMYKLQNEKPMTIGRRDENDIVFDNVSVSGRHAKVEAVKENFQVTDLKSTNGTFVNGNLITAHNLEHGDVISIGDHVLIFGYVKGEKIPEKKEVKEEEEENWSEKTMVLDAEEYREVLTKTATDISPKMSSSPSPSPPAEKIGSLSFLAGGKGDVKLEKKLTKIGKDSGNEIVVGGFSMGKVAATIGKMPKGYQLSYVGGRSKPKVNGAVVKESVKLEDFDIIEIGSTKMTFLLKD